MQELTVGTFIPNDTCLVGGNDEGDPEDELPQLPPHGQSQSKTTTASASPASPRMLIMTGPNYSGKSVYLKQVALIVYMAHIGW